jgi:uncharacterized membrane protein YeaQ/YmgE (transglycosylase-associated protein family)
MDILSWIVVGLIAGLLAGMVMKGGYGLIGDLILGVVGAVLGGWLATKFFGLGGVTGINFQSIIIAFVGAVIIMFAVRILSGRRAY